MLYQQLGIAVLLSVSTIVGVVGDDFVLPEGLCKLIGAEENYSWGLTLLHILSIARAMLKHSTTMDFCQSIIAQDISSRINETNEFIVQLENSTSDEMNNLTKMLSKIMNNEKKAMVRLYSVAITNIRAAHCNHSQEKFSQVQQYDSSKKAKKLLEMEDVLDACLSAIDHAEQIIAQIMMQSEENLNQKDSRNMTMVLQDVLKRWNEQLQKLHSSVTNLKQFIHENVRFLILILGYFNSIDKPLETDALHCFVKGIAMKGLKEDSTCTADLIRILMHNMHSKEQLPINSANTTNIWQLEARQSLNSLEDSIWKCLPDIDNTTITTTSFGSTTIPTK